MVHLRLQFVFRLFICKVDFQFTNLVVTLMRLMNYLKGNLAIIATMPSYTVIVITITDLFYILYFRGFFLCSLVIYIIVYMYWDYPEAPNY